MKLIWLTDIHLNFLGEQKRKDFYQKIIEASGDRVLISGDIAEAPSISEILKEMAKIINKPIYFVLGNHDYYRGQVNSLRQEMIDLTKNEALLYWLPALDTQDLGNQTMLIGEDCWADGRYGDYANSRVSLNDSLLIKDLYQSSILGKYPLLEKMQQLADKDAERLKGKLMATIKIHHPEKIIILTHVPPFREVCLHEGRISSDDFLPFFASKATGDVLVKIAQENPDIEFLAFCGHTHSKAYWKPYSNLTVKVGASEYTRPEIQEFIPI